MCRLLCHVTYCNICQILYLPGDQRPKWHCLCRYKAFWHSGELFLVAWKIGTCKQLLEAAGLSSERKHDSNNDLGSGSLKGTPPLHTSAPHKPVRETLYGGVEQHFQILDLSWHHETLWCTAWKPAWCWVLLLYPGKLIKSNVMQH